GRGDGHHGPVRRTGTRVVRRQVRAGRPGRRQQGRGRRGPGPGVHPYTGRRARRTGRGRRDGRAGRARRDHAQAEPGDSLPHLDRKGIPRMTMTTRKAPPPGATAPVKAPSPAEIAALIADAPTPRPTLLKTFNAMMAREFRVLRRNAIAPFTRAVMQPLLFVFVFAYVFPKIGGGFNLGGGATAGGAGAAAAGGVNFATLLVPGLMASMLLMQGIMAVTFPLVMEFSWQRTIEDRALAPV